MIIPQFSWDTLAQYKQNGRFIDGLPDDRRSFWSPYDHVHDMLVALLNSAQHSIVINMYGWDDSVLDNIVRNAMLNERIYVQMSLDKTQAGGKTEKALLAQWPANSFGTSIAIGQSSKHAISHLKVCIVDGVYTVKGSTNWSLGGEGAQDNELSLSRNPAEAAEARAILDLNHSEMIKQMQK